MEKFWDIKQIFLYRYTTLWKILGNYKKFQEMLET